MKLIDDWGKAWKFWSIRLNALGNTMLVALLAFPAIAQEIWTSLPMEVKSILPSSIAYWIPVAIFIASGIARLVRQGKTDGE